MIGIALQHLWSKFSGAILALGGILAAVALAYSNGRRAGIERIQKEQEEARERAEKLRQEITDDVESLSDDQLDRSGRDWLRKPER